MSTSTQPYEVMHGHNQVAIVWAISRNAAIIEARKLGLNPYACHERIH